MREGTEIIAGHRAARAAGGGPALDTRRKHEVIDDELAASLEQSEEARLAVRSVEDVILFDSDHWQAAAFRGQRVVYPCRGLLFDQQLIACLLPLGA